jgi:hypothetical protein
VYFFLGYGLKAVICWVSDPKEPSFSVLNSDEPPSKDQIDAYQAQFKNDDNDDSAE